MKKKVRGMTLIELIISISISTVILGIMGTFLISNSRMLTTTDLKSDMQRESQAISNEFLTRGVEATNIEKIAVGSTVTPVNSGLVTYTGLDANNTINLNEIVFKAYDDYGMQESHSRLCKIKLVGNRLTVINAKYDVSTSDYSNGVERVLATHVRSLTITPVDAINLPVADRATKSFKTTQSFKITSVIEGKEGLVDLDIPVEVLVQFRNNNAESM